MKKVKEWLPENYNILQISDLSIILENIWDQFAVNTEAAQKMIDDEIEAFNQAVEDEYARIKEVISKGKNKRKSSEKVFL